MEEVEVRLRKLQEELASLRSLTDHSGWKELMEFADGQVKLREPGILERVDNLLEITGKEFDKGEISGIRLFQALPEVRIEALLEDIAKLEGELGYDDGERTSDGDDGDGRELFEPPV